MAVDTEDSKKGLQKELRTELMSLKTAIRTGLRLSYKRTIREKYGSVLGALLA